MTQRTGRFALIEQLIADGVEYMFGNPGTSEEGFLDALLDYPQLRYVLALQECTAVGMADGYARATRRLGVVQLHAGVGLGNGIGMLYQARRGHAPLVVLAGEAGLRYDALEAQMAADLPAMAREVTKWSTRVVDPGSLLRVMRRAVQTALTPPMGPVFVSLPMDVLDAPNDEPVRPSVPPCTSVAPEPALVTASASLLAAAEHPLIVVGDGVAFSGAQAELGRVAELLGAGVWGADSSEVNLSAAHPAYRGLLGHMFGDNSQPILAQADAVLVVGTYLLPEVFPTVGPVFAPGARVVHIDLDASQIAKNHPVDLGLVSDPRLTLAALATALERAQTPAQRQAAAARLAALAALSERERAQALQADVAARDAVPLRPARFMQEIAARLPPEAIIFDEAITTSPDLCRYLRPTRPGAYFQTRGGSLGVGIPGALGMKLAHPDRPVVAFTGDGGSMYTIQALWTAARYRIGAKFVVCNNGGYQILKYNLQRYWGERHLAERDFPASFALAGPDLRFAELAQAMGVPGVRVERPEQIAPALQQALAHDGPYLIDLVIDGAVPAHAAPARRHS